MTPLPTGKWERGVVLQCRPDLRRRVQNILERTRQHSDDRDWRVCEHHLTSDDRGIGTEAAPPQAVADECDDRAAGPPRSVVGRLEVASESRRHTQRTKVVGTDVLALEPFWLADTGRCWQ